jgi:HAD superfamily hydrolase (TIGR01509 family)
MIYWEKLAAEFLERKGVRTVSPDILERIKPMTMTESAALFIQEYGLPGTAESVAAEMNAMMDDHYRKDIPLKSGVQEYLETLHRKGVTMCVASATAEELMDACLSRLGIAQYFSFLLSCETVGAGKNQPDVYWEAAKRLGAEPAEIAVYEDALYAAETAKQAGFYTIAVRDDSSRPHWETLAALADEVIHDWREAAQAL